MTTKQEKKNKQDKKAFQPLFMEIMRQSEMYHYPMRIRYKTLRKASKQFWLSRKRLARKELFND